MHLNVNLIILIFKLYTNNSYSSEILEILLMYLIVSSNDWISILGPLILEINNWFILLNKNSSTTYKTLIWFLRFSIIKSFRFV